MKIKFNFLKKKKFLIFDAVNSKYFNEYLDPKDTEILHCRKEHFNFWILLKCVIFLKLNYRNYIFLYIKKIKPESIFTLIDNGTIFYEIKNKINCKTYSVQNGLRTEYEDFFAKDFHKPSDLSCDKIFVWNKTIGEKYKKFVKCKYVSIGSFKNNVNKNIKTFKSEVLYVSTYRSTSLAKKIYKDLTWSEFIKNEKKLLTYIEKYCTEKNFKLSILGRYNEDQGEKLYFQNNFKKNYHFDFIKNELKRPTYQIAKNSKFIITIDSTLGYEMLAAGNKVALFGIRPEKYPLNTRNFLWPNYRRGKGKYWINDENLSFEEFAELNDSLLKIKEKEWEEEIIKIRNEVMNYDPGNKIFIKETDLK